MATIRVRAFQQLARGTRWFSDAATAAAATAAAAAAAAAGKAPGCTPAAGGEELAAAAAELAKLKAEIAALRRKEEEIDCIVCMAARRAVLFLPCRHWVACSACSARLPGARCPACSAIIKEFIHAYQP